MSNRRKLEISDVQVGLDKGVYTCSYHSNQGPVSTEIVLTEHGKSKVRTFEICRASHVTKKLDYPCAEIRAVMNLKLSVFLVTTT